MGPRVIIVILFLHVMRHAQQFIIHAKQAVQQCIPDVHQLHNRQEQVFVMMCVIKLVEGTGFFRSLPHFFSVILHALILCGCITDFEANVDEVTDILVVEGIITDDESVITLSRSKGLSYKDNIFDLSPYRVTDAKVYIECDDGTQWGAIYAPDLQSGGQYTVQTGKLNPARQYRLKIEHEAHEYLSEYAYLTATPEIDSVFWTKRDRGQPVNIHVATHASDSLMHYYRWSYREDWETRARITDSALQFPYVCSNNSKSRGMVLGATGKTTFGRLTEIIAQIPPNNDRFQILYRMDVTQNEISKRAYDFFSNNQKNARQSGSLFAQIPAELKGNITCITDPARIVIGYMVVSSTTRNRLYISQVEVYEDNSYNVECKALLHNPYSGNYVLLPGGGWVQRKCVDCEANGGRPVNEFPDDWPIQY